MNIFTRKRKLIKANHLLCSQILHERNDARDSWDKLVVARKVIAKLEEELEIARKEPLRIILVDERLSMVWRERE